MNAMCVHASGATTGHPPPSYSSLACLFFSRDPSRGMMSDHHLEPPEWQSRVSGSGFVIARFSSDLDRKRGESYKGKGRGECEGCWMRVHSSTVFYKVVWLGFRAQGRRVEGTKRGEGTAATFLSCAAACTKSNNMVTKGNLGRTIVRTRSKTGNLSSQMIHNGG